MNTHFTLANDNRCNLYTEEVNSNSQKSKNDLYKTVFKEQNVEFIFMMAIFSYLSTLTQFIAAYGKTLELLEASYECWKHLDFVVGQINCPQVCGEFLQIFWELYKQRHMSCQ